MVDKYSCIKIERKVLRTYIFVSIWYYALVVTRYNQYIHPFWSLYKHNLYVIYYWAINFAYKHFDFM